MSSYRSGSVGRFDYSSTTGNSNSRYRPIQASSYTPRYSSTTSAASSAIPRSFRAASYDPFADNPRSTTTSAYRSPYNRESAFDRPSGSSAMSSSYHSDYTSKSRFGNSGADRYKPTSTAMSTSAFSASSRYKPTTVGLPPSRSTSYASGLSFEPSSGTTSKYMGLSNRSGVAGMSTSSYTPSTSHYSRPRVDYRSQTPSLATRDPPATSRYDRDYRSMSRFDAKESSVDRVEETFSKLYNRYVHGSGAKTSSSSSSSAASSVQNSPIVKKFISHSEAEEELSCESEPEGGFISSTLQRSKAAFPSDKTLKEKTPTPGTAAPNKSSASIATTTTSKSAADGPKKSVETTSAAAKAVLPSTAAAKATIKAEPDKGSATKTSPSKAKSPVPQLQPPSKTAETKPSPAVTKASFEEKYKDLPKTEVKIEPQKLKGTSELDKLLRLAEFEKNPKSILQQTTALPKVIQSAVKATTPSPAKPEVKAPVKASSEAPASVPKTVTKKEKTPEVAKAEVKVSSNNSRSKSPVPDAKTRSKSPSASVAPEKHSLAAKRSQRRERTIEMEKYVQSKLEQSKQEQEAKDRVPELPQVTSERRPPLLLVTQPSVPSTPISTSANIVWNASTTDEASDSEWDEEDEEGSYSEEDYDFTISLPVTAAPQGDLYPVDESRLRSTTPFSDYDSEFELPFIQADSRNDSRGRVSQSNAAPPPIFVASVTYDDEWGSKHSAESDPEESQYFTVGSRLGAESAMSRTYLSPADFPSEDEYIDDVEVGCTLTLVEKAAMKGSDEETDSEFYSEYSDEEYTEEEYSYYEEEEEEYYTDEEEEDDEEWDEDVEMTASLYLPPTYEKSPSPDKVEIKREKTPEARKNDLKKSKTPEPVKEAKETPPELPKKSEGIKEKAPEPKKTETKASDLNKAAPTPSKAKTPEPVKKEEAIIRKEKTPDTKNIEKTPAKTASKEIKSETGKVEVEKPNSKTNSVVKPEIKPSEMKEVKKSVATAEDKSGIRKSMSNMAEEERKKAEEKRAEAERERARQTGTVSSMRDRFREPTPPKQEKITYKRSKLLQAREEIRPKRTYAPIVKPVLNDEFDKQMEELREKMKTGSSKLQAEYSNLSKGINSKVDEQKLKSLESKHKDLLGSSQSLLTKAEEEKKRWQEQHLSKTEKQYRETLEKEEMKLKRLEEEKAAAMLSRPEVKKTIRRSKKKAEAEAAKSGITEPSEAPESAKKEVEVRPEVATKASPPSRAAPATKVESKALPVEELKKITPSVPSNVPPFKSPVNKEESDLESIATAMAKKKPDPVIKSEAGGVANKLKKLRAEKAASPIAVTEADTTKPSPEKIERGPRKYSARRKTEEIIPLVKEVGTTRKRKIQPHRKNRFTKKPFDIDLILGWDKENGSFEKMEAFFETQSSSRRVPASSPAEDQKAKKRRIEAQKVWISELKDIDKIYKASELRDIKMTAVS